MVVEEEEVEVDNGSAPKMTCVPSPKLFHLSNDFDQIIFSFQICSDFEDGYYGAGCMLNLVCSSCEGHVGARYRIV